MDMIAKSFWAYLLAVFGPGLVLGGALQARGQPDPLPLVAAGVAWGAMYLGLLYYAARAR